MAASKIRYPAEQQAQDETEAASTVLDAEDVLQKARAALDEGEVDFARELAHEVMRRATERYQTGRVPALDRMAFHENRYATRAKAGKEGDLFKGYRIARTALWFLASALLRCWQGDQEAAVLLLGQAQEWASQYKTNTWLESFEHWIRMEFAWAAQDWKQAAEHCATLIEVAKRHEYEQLVCIGYVFASQIHEHLGEYADRTVDASSKNSLPCCRAMPMLVHHCPLRSSMSTG